MQYQVKDLDQNSRKVDIIIKLIQKFEPRYAKGYKITNFIGADPSGAITIPFWNDDSTTVKVGDFIEIQNGYVSCYKDKIQLNVGRYGSFKRVDPPEGFELSNELPLELEKKEVEVTLVEDLETQTKNLSLQVSIKEIVDDRMVTTKYDGKEHRVVSFLVGDESGCIFLDLWDDLVDTVNTGMVVRITGAYVKTFRQKRFLNISRNGTITPNEEKVSINCTNNLSVRSFG